MYSVPEQAREVFQSGILSNPLISKDLPNGFQQYGDKIKFQGSNKPSMPINWRFAESISAMKALEGTMLLALLDKKYNIQPNEIVINTYVRSYHTILLLSFINDILQVTMLSFSSCQLFAGRSIQRVPRLRPRIASTRPKVQSSWRNGSLAMTYTDCSVRFIARLVQISTKQKTKGISIYTVRKHHLNAVMYILLISPREYESGSQLRQPQIAT